MFNLTGKQIVVITVAFTGILSSAIGSYTGSALHNYRLSALEAQHDKLSAKLDNLQEKNLLTEARMNTLQVNLLNEIHSVGRQQSELKGMMEQIRDSLRPRAELDWMKGHG